jgi:uncharacterized protein YfdQ (DUF2303 family)
MADLSEFEAELARTMAATPLAVSENGGAILPLPPGYTITDLEAFQGRPNRMRADHVFRDTRSLALYLERYAEASSLALSDPEKRLIRVVVDYHEHKPRAAQHGEHIASFSARFTAEYAAWRAISGKLKSQVDAGMFLEDRATDVIEPDAAAIMDMVMTFDALKKVTFRQSTRLHDGQRQFTYSEENEARGNVTLPERIMLLLPIFEGQDPERIMVRVRYRIEDGSLKFQFDIADQKLVEDEAFRRCEDALAVDAPSGLLILRASL